MGAALGIDLGTTNTVVAAAIPDNNSIIDVDIPQLVAPGEVASLPQLPSTLYLPAAAEFDAASLALPWGPGPAWPVGQLARLQGIKVPGRAVVSAKSWLSVATIDRQSRCLPWAVDDDQLPRVSPVFVQTEILAHVAAAARHRGLPLDDVTITIPASFDQVARELTLEAAAAAGLQQVRLLEEPQAALYALLQRASGHLVELFTGVRLVLVVDVGGGTTDFTLLSIEAQPKGPPRVERIAVGDHVMLGGDNMDITLARRVEQKLTGAVGTLDAVSFAHLVLSARLAKETLLADDAPAEVGVTLLSRGKKLLGGGKTSVESTDEVRRLLLDGFFPLSLAHEVLERSRGGLAELGLPYARDPAIPRHISTFLRRHVEAAAASGARVVDGLPIPDAVLLNGGVFRAATIRARLRELFARWAGHDDAVRFFDVDHDDLDRAVARGAASSSLVRQGRGVRIGSGGARAYFVGVAGDDGVERALCVAARGQKEGAAVEVARTFRAVVGEPAVFPLYSSTYSTAKAGDVVDVGELERLPSISTVLQPLREVPVRLEATVSEIGTVELALRMTPEALERFRLSFSTRLDGVVEASAAAAPGALPSSGPVHKKIDDGKELILGFFGNKSKDVDPKRVKDLRRDLEKLFGPREQWSLGLARELAGVLLAGAARRRRSAEHERAYFQNLGFMLRPGTGAPFDDWRIEQLWPVWADSVQYVAEKPTWGSWFVMWRRVAAGLDAARQQTMWAYLKPWLLEQGTGKKGTGPTPSGTDEMIRLAAALERLPAAEKVQLGEFIKKKLGRGGLMSAWPLGRVGSRAPLAGQGAEVVSADVAAAWIEAILELDVKSVDGAAFALVQLARLTGDRARDVDPAVRAKVLARLTKAGVPPETTRPLQQVVALSGEEASAAFGESLPAGLRL